MYNKLRRIIDYVESPILLKSRLQGIRVDFVTEFILIRNLMAVRPKTIIDVGANRGEFLRAANFMYPNADIFAFEPIESLYLKLKSEFSNDRMSIFNVALGSENAKQSFYETGADDLSSLLRPTELLKTRVVSDNEAVAREGTITVKTMDNVLSDRSLDGPILIKIDVQGTELGVLKGAEETLKRSDCIKIECDFEYLYEGQDSYIDIFMHLYSRGFTRFLQVDEHYSDSRITRCDLVFFRS